MWWCVIIMAGNIGTLTDAATYTTLFDAALGGDIAVMQAFYQIIPIQLKVIAIVPFIYS